MREIVREDMTVIERRKWGGRNMRAHAEDRA